jgi:hypothetical protein
MKNLSYLSWRRLGAMALFAAMLTACGGGGGGGGGGQPPAPTPTPVFNPANAQQINSVGANTLFAENAAVATDASGNGMAIWVQSEALTGIEVERKVFARRFNAQTGQLEAPQSIGLSNARRSIDDVRIKFNNQGRALALWRQKSQIAGESNLVASIYSPQSGQWTTSELTANGTTSGLDSADEPDIAFDPAGNAVVVWVKTTRASSTTFTVDTSLMEARLAAQSTTWTFGTVFGPSTAYRYSQPRVAYAANGDILLVALETNSASLVPSRPALYRYSTSQGWHAGHVIDGQPSYYFEKLADEPDGASQGLDLASNDAGDIAIVWQHRFTTSDGTGRSAIFTSALTPSGAWTARRMVDVGAADDLPSGGKSGKSSLYPRIALGSQGKALIAWQQEDVKGGVNSPHSVYAARFDVQADVMDVPPTLIEKSADFAGLPIPAMDAQGHGVVGWLQADPGNEDNLSLLYSRFDATELRFGEPTFVESAQDASIADTGETFSLSLAGNGTGYVVWQQIKDGATPRSSIMFNRYQ